MSHYVLDGKYVLKNIIEKGSQSTVVLAECEGQQVVVKLYKSDSAVRDARIESGALCSIDHEGVAKVVGYGERKILKATGCPP